MAEAIIIDGKAIAAGLQQRVAATAAKLRDGRAITAGLAAVLVGDDPASQVYVRNKARACAAVGLASFEHRLPANTRLPAILDLVGKLNADERVDGILVQLPLPSGIDPRRVIAAIGPGSGRAGHRDRSGAATRGPSCTRAAPAGGCRAGGLDRNFCRGGLIKLADC